MCFHIQLIYRRFFSTNLVSLLSSQNGAFNNLNKNQQTSAYMNIFQKCYNSRFKLDLKNTQFSKSCFQLQLNNEERNFQSDFHVFKSVSASGKSTEDKLSINFIDAVNPLFSPSHFVMTIFVESHHIHETGKKRVK